MHRRAAPLIVALLALAPSAHADDVLKVGEIRVDAPTMHAAGVQVLISGDDNRNAKITARVRKAGSTTYRPAPPLFRVFPETVSVSVPQQFAGSIFDLEPGSSYEVELHAVDPDGSVDVTKTFTLSTRPIPRSDPATPRKVAVKTAAELKAALAAAKAGDVITLADGVYAGPFSFSASGTVDNPIVLRGESASGAILDGGGCAGCNILEVYGSFVHVEKLTLRSATRALRFLGAAAKGIVARRLVIKDVVHGIKINDGIDGAYVCDNVIEGRLVWPWTFASDATSHWDDRGIDVAGFGEVVCHNRITGFGDPIVNKHSRFRSFDVYGNDIGESFDGTELDEGETSRLWGNRFVNVMAPVSIQPVYGGPAYVLRNVLMNVPDEQIKLKSLGGTNLPSGAVVYHNTFVSPVRALNLQTPITQHNFVIGNNLFVGPKSPTGRVVDWTAKIQNGLFDFNGYYPDGGFWFGVVAGSNRVYSSFAAAQAAGVEKNGVLLTEAIFAGGFVGPTDGKAKASPPDFTLASGSNAIDKGQKLPGINDGFKGAGPDLGALERGCPANVYGPRPEGTEAVAARVDCAPSTPVPGDAGPGDDAGSTVDGGTSDDAGSSVDGGGPSVDGGDLGATPIEDAGGCGCRATNSGEANGALLALALSAIILRRRAAAARA